MPSQPRNRIGEVYGKLTVVRISKKRTTSGNAYWWCICCCGNEREVPSYSLSHKVRRRKNITACKICSHELTIEGVCQTNDKKEKNRREEAIHVRKKLSNSVPKRWLELALTDSHARELGQKHFFRGIRCLNGHISPYRINGGCLECAKNKKDIINN